VMNEAYRVPTQPHFATITWAGGGDPLGAARAVLQTVEMDYAWNLQLAPEVLARMLEGGRGELLVGFGSLMERLVFNLADPSPDLPGALREARARPHLNRPGFPRGCFVQSLGGVFKGVHPFVECVLHFLRRPMPDGAV